MDWKPFGEKILVSTESEPRNFQPVA